MGILKGDHLGDAIQFFTVGIIQLKGSQARKIPKTHVQARSRHVVHIATVGVVAAGRLPMDIQIDACSFDRGGDWFRTGVNRATLCGARSQRVFDAPEIFIRLDDRIATIVIMAMMKTPLYGVEGASATVVVSGVAVSGVGVVSTELGLNSR